MTTVTRSGSSFTALRPRTNRSGANVRPPVGRRSGLFVVMFVTVSFLSVLGLVMVLSASSAEAVESGVSAWSEFRQQVVWLGIGIVAMVVGVRVDHQVWRRLAMPMWLGSVFLLGLVLVPGVGVRVNGAARWLAIGSMRFQPSELVKFTTAVVIAELLSRPRRNIEDLRATLRPAGTLFGVVAVLLLLEPDMDTALIIGAIVLSMLFTAGLRLRVVATLVGVVAAGSTLIAIAAPYRRERLLAYRDPWADPLNTGYQTIQSLVSVANGGATGMGVGNGRVKFGYLPFAHSDFIFAVIAEELGFVGAVAVIGIFALLGVLGMVLVIRTDDTFSRLLVCGIVTWIVLQAFMNIGGVLGVLPATGVTLPLLSAGGSALVVTLFALGVVMNVARRVR